MVENCVPGRDPALQAVENPKHEIRNTPETVKSEHANSFYALEGLRDPAG
jgi:hypothetical protein